MIQRMSSQMFFGANAPIVPPIQNTTPAPPTVISDNNTHTLDFTHVLGDTEILISVNNGAYTPFDGNVINVGENNRVLGYWKAKIRSANGRNESLPALSPLFFITQPVITNTINAVIPNSIPYPGYLTPVIDNSFGYDMEIIRISGVEWPSTDTQYSHGYSKNQRWSSDMALSKCGDGQILDGHNFAWKFALSKQDGGKTIWSNTSPKKLFGFGANTIEVHTINAGNTANTRSVLIDFTTAAGYDAGYGPSLMSEGDMSLNDTYTVVQVKRATIFTYAVCNLQTALIDSFKTKAQIETIIGCDASGRFDWVSISKSGNYIVANRVESTDGKGGKWVFNLDWTPVIFGGVQVNLGTHSHMDFAFDAAGNEVMTKMGIPGYVNLLTGAQTTVISTAVIDAAWGNNHEGGHSSGTGEAGWGLYSFHSVRSATQITNNAAQFYPYIVYAKLDGSQTYRRFAHARRSEVGANYDNEIKGCISRDGKYVMYDSNWFQDNTPAKAYIARLKVA